MNACIILPESSINKSNTSKRKRAAEKLNFSLKYTEKQITYQFLYERSKTIYIYFVMESLILAQNKRWRRA